MIFIALGGYLDGHRQASEEAIEAKKNGKDTMFISQLKPAFHQINHKLTTLLMKLNGSWYI